jgi:hypothetical protein
MGTGLEAVRSEARLKMSSTGSVEYDRDSKRAGMEVQKAIDTLDSTQDQVEIARRGLKFACLNTGAGSIAFPGVEFGEQFGALYRLNASHIHWRAIARRGRFRQKKATPSAMIKRLPINTTLPSPTPAWRFLRNSGTLIDKLLH